MPDRLKRGETTQKRALVVSSASAHFSIRAVTMTLEKSSLSSTFCTVPSLTFLWRISVLAAARPMAVWKVIVMSGPRSE